LTEEYPETLETRFAAAAEPELIARHLTEAGRIEQAIDYWLCASVLRAAKALTRAAGA
jgi:hypothetical protein